MSSPKPVNDMLALLCSTFRCEIDSYQKRAYVRTLVDIPGPVLLAAADALINESAAGRKFYPMPTAPDVKGACAKVIERKRLEAYQASLPATCALCGHEKDYPGARWKSVTVNGIERLTQCDCRTVALEAADRVGQAIALPPSREDALEIGS